MDYTSGSLLSIFSKIDIESNQWKKNLVFFKGRARVLR
jgi:hypothetical protein